MEQQRSTSHGKVYTVQDASPRPQPRASAGQAGGAKAARGVRAARSAKSVALPHAAKASSANRRGGVGRGRGGGKPASMLHAAGPCASRPQLADSPASASGKPVSMLHHAGGSYVVKSEPANALGGTGKLKLTLKRPEVYETLQSASSSENDSSESGSEFGSDSESCSGSTSSSSGSNQEEEYMPAFNTYNHNVPHNASAGHQAFIPNGSPIYPDNHTPQVWLPMSSSAMSSRPLPSPSLMSDRTLASSDAFMIPPFSDTHNQSLDMMTQPSNILSANPYMTRPMPSYASRIAVSPVFDQHTMFSQSSAFQQGHLL